MNCRFESSAHSFIDGAYVRHEGRNIGVPFPHPLPLTNYIVSITRNLGGGGLAVPSVLNRRTSVYDAEPGTDIAEKCTGLEGLLEVRRKASRHALAFRRSEGSKAAPTEGR